MDKKRGIDSDSLISKSVGGCEILEFAGEGSMGRVYKAMQDIPMRHVAIKVPRDDSLIALLYQYSDKRFQREIIAMSETEAPHVLPIYRAGEEDGILYIIMKWCPYDFGNLMEEEGVPETKEDIIRWVNRFSDSVEGLGNIHKKGYVLRDVKKSGIRIDENGVIFAGDFSLAKLIKLIDKEAEEEILEKTKLTSIDQIIGTPEYMSPEQTRPGANIDERSDIWSLGVVMYELLTGHKPFEKEVWESDEDLFDKINNSYPRNLRFFNKAISNDLQSIVLKLLEKDPEKRYQSAVELSDHLEKFRLEERISIRSYWERPLKRHVKNTKDYVRSHRVPVGIGLLILATVLPSGWFLRQRHVENLREQAAIERQEQVYMASIDCVLDQFDITAPTDYVTIDSLLTELKPRLVEQKLKPLIEKWRSTYEFPFVTNKGVWQLFGGNTIYTEGIFIDLLNEISETDSTFKKDVLDWTNTIMPNEGEKLPLYDIRHLYFKHAYNLTDDERYKNVIFDAVDYFNKKRFVENAGYFKRQNFRQRYDGLSEEIIDIGSMGDRLLPLMWYGIHETDDKEYSEELLYKVMKHVKTTANILIREDGSIREFGYFVIDEDGEQRLMDELTLFGHGYLGGPYGDNPSCPARFQALAIDGFVNTYKEITKLIDTVNDEVRKKELLEFREFVLEKTILLADYYIDNLPEDYISHFDFMHPDLIDTEKRKNVLKDTSPTITIYLPFSDLSEITNNGIYQEVASKGLDTILTKKDENGNRMYISTNNQTDEGIIKGVCWSIRNNEVDISDIETERNFIILLKK